MSNSTPTPPPAPHAGGSPSSPTGPAPRADAEAPRQRNVLGFVALGVAALGFLLAVIPGFLIGGWVLLPIGFILGIVVVCLRGKAKWPGVAAIIVAVVGTIAGVIAFAVMTANAVSEAFGPDEVSVVEQEDAEQPADEPQAEEPAEVEPAETSEAGTRENPLSLGTEVRGSDWAVTVNSVELDANKAIRAENSFDDGPGEGKQYVLVNITATYLGEGSGMPAEVGVAYVTADGTTVNSYDKIVMTPDSFDSLSELYTDASTTGNIAFAVPSATAADGVLAVEPGFLSDRVFFAVQ